MFFQYVWQYARTGRRSTNRSSRSSSGRSGLRFERLEEREMLSVSPTVTDVAVASTDWTSGFYDYLSTSSLGDEGYSIPVGSAAQTQALPWDNIDQIKITFSEDVNVDAADLSLSGVNNTSYQVESFFYDAVPRVATWTLASPLVVDRLMLDLDADGLDPVADLDGNLLDGEWVDNVTSGPSGNGSTGGDFQFSLNVVPGDADQSQSVSYFDYIFTRMLDGQGTSSPNYDPFHDLDGSGLIDSTDWSNILGYLGDFLPSGQPAGATNDAPTTAGIASVVLDNAAIDEAISLFAAFDDAEDADSQLTFTILGNTNPSVLDTLSINPTTGVLTVSATSNVSGRTTLTVQATDTQGLTTETDVTIDADYVNLPPVISNFWASQHPGNTWLFTGTVSDPDDDVEGWVVEFGGVFDLRATVDENGYFELAVVLEEDEWGYEWVITTDPHGLESNQPARWVGLT